MVLGTSLLDENPLKFLFLNPDSLVDGMIAQIPQEGKGAPAWVSRPQQGDIRHRPLPGSLGSGPSAFTMRQPLAAVPPAGAAARPYRFSAPKPKPDDRSPVPPWLI